MSQATTCILRKCFYLKSLHTGPFQHLKLVSVQYTMYHTPTTSSTMFTSIFHMSMGNTPCTNVARLSPIAVLSMYRGTISRCFAQPICDNYRAQLSIYVLNSLFRKHNQFAFSLFLVNKMAQVHDLHPRWKMSPFILRGQYHSCWWLG